MALDGVTTALELEVGVPDVGRFIDARRGRSPVHFGASASHLAARLRSWDTPLPVSILGPEAGIIPQSGAATNAPASPERLERILAAPRSQLDAGALGVGIGLEYAPGATRHEVIAVARLAAAHGRRGGHAPGRRRPNRRWGRPWSGPRARFMKGNRTRVGTCPTRSDVIPGGVFSVSPFTRQCGARMPTTDARATIGADA